MPTSRQIITNLVETPQSIPADDFGASMDVSRHDVAKMLLPGATQVATVQGTAIYLNEKPRAGLATFFAVEGELVTLMATVTDEEITQLGMTAVLVALWRGPDAPPGLSGRVFWEVLLPRHRVVVSGPWPHIGTSKAWSDWQWEAFERGHRCGTVNTLRGSVVEFRVKNDITAGRFVEPATEGELANERYFIAK